MAVYQQPNSCVDADRLFYRLEAKESDLNERLSNFSYARKVTEVTCNIRIVGS